MKEFTRHTTRISLLEKRGECVQQEVQKYSIYFEVEGSKALFADPVSRIGKEKNSYPVPTQSALIGICKNIYWKPTIEYQITECRVMNEIQYEAMNKLVPHFYDDKKDLSTYKYLKNIRYKVRGYIIPNPERPDLIDDFSAKHLDIFNRSLEVGGRFLPYLGASECMAFVSPTQYDTENGFYDNVKSLHIGMMYNVVSYNQSGRAKGITLFDCYMKRGIIHFPVQEQCAYYDTKHPDQSKALPSKSDAELADLDVSETVNSLQSLLQLYPIAVDNDDTKDKPLPASHIGAASQLTVVLTKNGKFSGAYANSDDDVATVIPVTLESASRTATPVPHLLTEKLEYLCSDSPTPKNDVYMQQINALKNPPAEVCAIREYLCAKTLSDDIAFLCDEKGCVRNSKVAFKDAVVRFMVDDVKTWEAKHIQTYFDAVASAKVTQQGLDYLTGEITNTTVRTIGKIRSDADMAKLISSNDSRGCAFRDGAFVTAEECVSLGYHSSQKALSTLRWLIRRQSVHVGSLTCLVWTNHPEQNYGKQLNNLIFKWDDPEETIDPITDVHWLLLDTVDGGTKGRISVCGEGFLPGSTAVDNLRYWYQSNRGKIWRDKKWIDGSPSLLEIINAAYGSAGKKWEAPDSIKRLRVRELIPGILQGTLNKESLLRNLETRIMQPLKIPSWNWLASVEVYRALTHAEDSDTQSLSYQAGRLLRDYELLFYNIPKFADSFSRVWHPFLLQPKATWTYQMVPLLKICSKTLDVSSVFNQAKILDTLDSVVKINHHDMILGYSDHFNETLKD